MYYYLVYLPRTSGHIVIVAKSKNFFRLDRLSRRVRHTQFVWSGDEIVTFLANAQCEVKV
jgi:hypothetical protein